MSSQATPFGNRPTKPLAVRNADGSIGIFIGAAYQITDDAGAARFRDAIDILLAHPTGGAKHDQGERELLQQLTAELGERRTP